MSEIIKKISDLFEHRLQAKTGWGKDQVLKLYKDCVIEVLAEFADENLIEE
jgi:hypothetical protein